MSALARPRIPVPRRLALLGALPAAFMAWLALTGPESLPWDPRWFVLVHSALEVCSVVVIMLAFSTGWHGIGRRGSGRVALLAAGALGVRVFGVGPLLLA